MRSNIEAARWVVSSCFSFPNERRFLLFVIIILNINIGLPSTTIASPVLVGPGHRKVPRPATRTAIPKYQLQWHIKSSCRPKSHPLDRQTPLLATRQYSICNLFFFLNVSFLALQGQGPLPVIRLPARFEKNGPGLPAISAFHPCTYSTLIDILLHAKPLRCKPHTDVPDLCRWRL